MATSLGAGNRTVNKSENIFQCADRISPGDEPRDITAIKELYIPFDTSNKATHLQKNPFGVAIYRNSIAAGSIYQAFDGKRLVVEVGCETIVYLHINPQQPQRHHRLFIQSERAFSGDTTVRRDAAEIAHNTRHVETIAKYEMFFILGVLSTASLPAWLMVTGSDVTYLYASKKVVADAAKQLATTLLNELQEIGSYAPTLHAKVWELIVAEGKNNAVHAGKQLPATIAKDEKVQAQVAGIIFGKWAMPNGNSFNIWTLIGVLFTQAAVKSVTKYGDAYVKAIEQRYNPLIEEIRLLNLSQPSTFQKPAKMLVKLMQESGVTVSPDEAIEMLREVISNKDKAHKNFSNILVAVNTFRRIANK